MMKKRASQNGLSSDEGRRALQDLLTAYPELRRFVVGLDTAGPERRMPPRAFAHAYRKLQCFQCEHPIHNGELHIKLGSTCHVGEDSADMLTGLRHVDETARLSLQGSGRLGHALVLGEEADHFYRRRGRATEPSRGVGDQKWPISSSRILMASPLASLTGSLYQGVRRNSWAFSLQVQAKPLSTTNQVIAFICSSVEYFHPMRYPWLRKLESKSATTSSPLDVFL